jgi:hypothetical protein
LDTITDYPALKVVIDHEEIPELWLWHDARPGENERQKASQSWATVTSVRKALAGQRSQLAEDAPNEGSSCRNRQASWECQIIRAACGSDLSGHASVGYVNSVNAPTVARAVSTPSFDAVAAQIGLNYVLGRTLTCFILYSFSYQNNGAVLASERDDDVTVNQFQLPSSKIF